jgi:hypothetical protein
MAAGRERRGCRRLAAVPNDGTKTSRVQMFFVEPAFN